MKKKPTKPVPKNPDGCDPVKGGILSCGYKKGGAVKVLKKGKGIETKGTH